MDIDTAKIKRSLTARISFHIYFWTFLFLGWMAILWTDNTTFLFTVCYSLCIIISAMMITYLHFYVFNNFFMKKRYSLYFIFLIILVPFFGIFNQLFFSRVFDDKNGIFSFILNVSFILIITTSLKLTKAGIRQKFLFQEIKAKQLQSELDLLKSQVNPHFLFNTLNNLYGLVNKHSEEAAKGIARLSNLMRYMSQDCREETVNLQTEIQQIEELIELHKLRFADSDNIKIDFRIEGNPLRLQIAPMLLIPFVENAFKYGVHVLKPSFINIFLSVEENGFCFSVKNSIIQNKDTGDNHGKSSGLKNVTRRLELLYPESHSLKIQNSGDIFEVTLTINNLLPPK